MGYILRGVCLKKWYVKEHIYPNGIFQTKLFWLLLHSYSFGLFQNMGVCLKKEYQNVEEKPEVKQRWKKKRNRAKRFLFKMI